MDQERKSFIYQRLLDINIKIEPMIVPDPASLNELIWQCHNYIEEVERYFIEVSQISSALQTAGNNALAVYEYKKGDLLSKDKDIMVLPTAKERESKADQLLTEDIKTVREYKNEFQDVMALQKAINVKMRNLTRAGNDIKLQIRILEAQVKLKTPMKGSSAEASLAEEMAKSRIGKDSFEGAETSESMTNTVDPVKPLDMEEVFGSEPAPAPVDLVAPVIISQDSEATKEGSPMASPQNTMPTASGEAPVIISQDSEPETVSVLSEEAPVIISQDSPEEVSVLTPEEDEWCVNEEDNEWRRGVFGKDSSGEPESLIPVDLDSVLVPSGKVVERQEIPDTDHKEVPQKPQEGFDIDSLLDDIIQKEGAV